MTYSGRNGRELSNFLKYADVMGHGNWRDVLSRYLENRGTEEKTGGEDIPGVMPVRLDEVAAWHCERVYQQCGSISRAAELLGIQRATLRRHLLKRGSKAEWPGKELILFQEIGVCRIFSSCLDRIPTLL
ncbi:MAG: helix-turn-helix domain-containing protein [Akkermansia muciniphila]